eukprot:TRINITY_DN3018_c0_g1_i4.p1 TRINITY_DN3018_c0_g1~~TRINITY_DN3018_c0_g1_i4.p1  ORF type:complete len:533 (-),score=135.55 TRINITY_DN3018_c0_g1_i4:1-1599(-)
MVYCATCGEIVTGSKCSRCGSTQTTAPTGTVPPSLGRQSSPPALVSGGSSSYCDTCGELLLGGRCVRCGASSTKTTGPGSVVTRPSATSSPCATTTTRSPKPSTPKGSYPGVFSGLQHLSSQTTTQSPPGGRFSPPGHAKATRPTPGPARQDLPSGHRSNVATSWVDREAEERRRRREKEEEERHPALRQNSDSRLVVTSSTPTATPSWLRGTSVSNPAVPEKSWIRHRENEEKREKIPTARQQWEKEEVERARREEEARARREREEEERERVEREDEAQRRRQRQLKEEGRDREEKERKEQEERERRDREEKERKEQEERERRDRQEKERKEQEERERRDRQEKERKEQEEREKAEREAQIRKGGRPPLPVRPLNERTGPPPLPVRPANAPATTEKTPPPPLPTRPTVLDAEPEAETLHGTWGTDHSAFDVPAPPPMQPRKGLAPQPQVAAPEEENDFRSAWEETTDDNGEVFFFNLLTEESVWDLPPGHSLATSRPTPPGWEKGTTEDGRIFYVNLTTKRSQWEFPMKTP